MKVLFVDDDPGLLKIQMNIAKDMCLVKSCLSGERAIQIIDEWGPDLIFIDLILSGEMGGLDVLAYAKTKNPKILCIVVSGYTYLEYNAIRSLENKVDGFLEKPVFQDQYRSIIQKCENLINNGGI